MPNFGARERKQCHTRHSHCQRHCFPAAPQYTYRLIPTQTATKYHIVHCSPTHCNKKNDTEKKKKTAQKTNRTCKTTIVRHDKHRNSRQNHHTIHKTQLDHCSNSQTIKYEYKIERVFVIVVFWKFRVFSHQQRNKQQHNSKIEAKQTKNKTNKHKSSNHQRNETGKHRTMTMGCKQNHHAKKK